MRQAKSDRRRDLVTAFQTAEIEGRRLAILWGASLGRVLGLHPTDAIAMIFLLDAGEATAGEFARAVGLTTGAMTACIDRLLAAGLATRANHPEDRRKILVRPGKIPKRLLELRNAARARLAATLKRYSDDELRLLIDFERSMNELVRQSISSHSLSVSKRSLREGRRTAEKRKKAQL